MKAEEWNIRELSAKLDLLNVSHYEQGLRTVTPITTEQFTEMAVGSQDRAFLASVELADLFNEGYQVERHQEPTLLGYILKRKREKQRLTDRRIAKIAQITPCLPIEGMEEVDFVDIPFYRYAAPPDTEAVVGSDEFQHSWVFTASTYRRTASMWPAQNITTISDLEVSRQTTKMGEQPKAVERRVSFIRMVGETATLYVDSEDADLSPEDQSRNLLDALDIGLTSLKDHLATKHPLPQPIHDPRYTLEME